MGRTGPPTGRDFRIKMKTWIYCLLLLGVAGCGGGRETDPLYGVWTLKAVTGGFSGNGRSVDAGEGLTLYPNGGSWRRADGSIDAFRYRLQTNRLGERILVREDSTIQIVVEMSDTNHLTLREQAADPYTFELTR